MLDVLGFCSLDIGDIEGGPDESKFFIFVGEGVEVHGLCGNVIFFHSYYIITDDNYRYMLCTIKVESVQVDYDSDIIL